ncbi:DegQ family serine endoprotease [Xylella fastidiosa subsp. pauca]|uniref:DegQ family serine endoprotease n=1 Tax=Xylella fastidiosa TaxID=2371 RepID=UPI00249DC774|nr:DegQ family serine endoprotease [Xylella fastidiosa]WGZ32699.1 DegQ family serine endoprotease [Xylella fastidiosa subsp. pauca]
MNSRIHTRCFGLLAITLPLAACGAQHNNSPTPTAPSTPIVTPSTTPAPQLVAGLPDFTQLVDQVGPGVVNIETVITRKKVGKRRGIPLDNDIPEFFRRFFGPDFQMPNQPRGGQDDEGGIAGRGMGSGFIISKDGYILTNHHVITGASEVTIKLTDRREFKAKIIGSDEQYDVALLKIDAKNLPTVRIGDSSSLKSGQWVVAIGSPFGLDHSVTAGIVSALGRSTSDDQRYVPFIQTDVPINQGNSGGPLLNTRGEVIGINSQIFSASGGYMGISFAIPINLAINAAEQIRKTGKVQRSMLGVEIGPIDALKAQGLGLPDSRGALVNNIPPHSPAAKAGIEVGDVIRSVNGKVISSFSDLPPLIGMMPPGTKATLGIIRDGKPREIVVTLSALNQDATASEDEDDTAPSKPETSANVELLGLQVENLSAAEREHLASSQNAKGGVRITAVTAPWARNANPPLVEGLVILRIGRTPVSNVAELNRVLGNYKKGDVIMLLVTNGRGTFYSALKAGG